MIDLLAIALHIYGETGNEPKIQNSDLYCVQTDMEMDQTQQKLPGFDKLFRSIPVNVKHSMETHDW